MYATVFSDYYIGLAWDIRYPNIVGITHICKGNCKQIPLCMAWVLTIHKSQGLTFKKETIDISNEGRQGLTFTMIQKVKYIIGYKYLLSLHLRGMER